MLPIDVNACEKVAEAERKRRLKETAKRLTKKEILVPGKLRVYVLDNRQLEQVKTVVNAGLRCCRGRVGSRACCIFVAIDMLSLPITHRPEQHCWRSTCYCRLLVLADCLGEFV